MRWLGAPLSFLLAAGGACNAISGIDDLKFKGAGSTGGASMCVLPSDCPFEDTECLHRICVGGTCDAERQPEGTVVAAQTGGDCKMAVCGEIGNTVTTPDAADVPSDGNPCTLDVCSEGEASHPPAKAGKACGVGLSCDGAGHCAGCTAAEQCGVGDACTTIECNSDKICEFHYVAAGGGVPRGQQAGDCKRLTCNGMGGVSLELDNDDVPVDGNPCTLDLCSAGKPSNPAAAAGTPCGGSFECDGAGTCAGCTQASDCGVDTACAGYACVSGACKTTFVPAGQGDPGGQVAGDCKKKTCDGAGGPQPSTDDADVPDDANPCTIDTCSSGVPTFTNVAGGTTCGDCSICQQGQCVLKCNGCETCDTTDNNCYNDCSSADCLKCNTDKTGCESIPMCTPM